jgi:hypothetical protein
MTKVTVIMNRMAAFVYIVKLKSSEAMGIVDRGKTC